MSDLSPNLKLPLIAPSQAMKHVTHNEALARLDAVTQLSVEALDATVPPAAPQEGECYGIGTGAQDAWTGQDGAVAVFSNGGWLFVIPQPGWRAWDVQNGALRVFTAGQWLSIDPTYNNLAGVGINASYDAVNRLALASEASLFNHEGNGHQIKVNKAASTDTASLLYQTNFTGHAEMGLNGSNDWSLKTSADGAAWVEALVVDAATGLVGGGAVQAAPDDTTAGRLMRADYGYGPGNLLGTVAQSAGVPTGAVIENGSNANGIYTRFADGLQICQSPEISVDITTSVGAIYRSSADVWAYPAAFVDKPFVSGGSVNNASFMWVTAGQAGTISCRAAGFCYTSVSNREYSILAIGRWF